MNRSEEDYVKVIYEIELRQQSNDLVTNLQLMQYFSHTAQTVNEMIKKLSKKGLLKYKPYKGSALTQEGKNIAIRMLRVHRIWETFLVEKLGYSWEEVHEEAERLEHITSKKMEKRLFVFLGEPEACPHGNRIPGDESKETQKNALIDTVEQKEYCLESVVDDKEILTYLNGIDIKIGQCFFVSYKDPVSELMELVIDNRTVVIGYKVAQSLFVRKS